MEKFEYMLVKWDTGESRNRIALISSDEEPETINVKTQLFTSYTSEMELLEVINDLGEDGWELVSDMRVVYSIKLFSESRFLFKRKKDE